MFSASRTSKTANLQMLGYFKASVSQRQYVMRCAIWYHLYNFKNVNNAHGGMLFLVKLQAKSLQLY